MKKILLLFIGISMLTQYSVSQIIDSTDNYFFLKEKYESFYNDLLTLNGEEAMEGTGYKQFLRWK